MISECEMNFHPFLAGMLLLMTTVVNAEAVRSQRMDIPASVQRVVIETSGDLEIRPGAAGRLTVEAEPRVLQKLDNAFQRDTLYLRSKDSFDTQHGIRYVLEIPRLRSLTARGNGTAQIGAFQGDALELELVGNGDATIEGVAFKHLALRISGSGNIDISGRGETLDAAVNGVGNIRAENLVVAHAEATITGVGDIYLQATKQIKGEIVGSGHIRYKGRPETPPIGTNSIEPL